MKEYFIRLFEYDRYANQIILETIRKVNDPEKPVKLMAHLLSAQQVWLSRCKNLPLTGVVLWPDWPADALADVIAENSKRWIEHLKSLDPEVFEASISYQDTKGNSYENKLNDILAHAINHGTHHRAQAGQHLIVAGVEKLPPTDYIVYLRALHYWQT